MASQTQGGGNGDPNVGLVYLTKTKVGKLKLVSAILSFLGMCFVSAGIDWISRQGGKTPALGSASAALIILAWLFAVFIILAAFIPDLTKNPNFPKIDTFGHFLCAVTAAVGAGFGIGMVVETYVDSCTDRGTYKARNNCASFVFWIADISNGLIVVTLGLKLAHFIIASMFAFGQAIVSLLIWKQAKTQSTESGANF